MSGRIAIGSMQPEVNAGMIRLRRALDQLGAAIEKKAPAEAGAEDEDEEMPRKGAST